MRTLPFAAVLLLGAALGACGPLLEMAGNSAGLPSATKLVEAKVPPDVLIARDGSECHVPRARFEALQPGQHVTCVWTQGRTLDRPVHRPAGETFGDPPWRHGP